MLEEWKPIKFYEGLYEISNLGRVKSLERYRKGINNSSIFVPERILKPNLCKSTGYLQVSLHNNTKQKVCSVHRLVAIAFIENPENKPQVNHIDGNKQNNCVDNLEWTTCQENIQHAWDTGINKLTNKQKQGLQKGWDNWEKNLKKAQANITKESIEKSAKKHRKPVIATNLQTGEEIYFISQSEAEKQLKLAGGSTTNVLKGKFQQAGGYTFRYADPI